MVPSVFGVERETNLKLCLSISIDPRLTSLVTSLCLVTYATWYI